MAQPRLVERAKLFFFRNFERIFVLLLVFAIVAIHALVEQKFAFLSFYYLPLILAGFYGGRRFAVLAGVFVVVLVLFYQYVQGLDMLPGFCGDALLGTPPWRWRAGCAAPPRSSASTGTTTRSWVRTGTSRPCPCPSP